MELSKELEAHQSKKLDLIICIYLRVALIVEPVIPSGLVEILLNVKPARFIRYWSLHVNANSSVV